MANRPVGCLALWGQELLRSELASQTLEMRYGISSVAFAGGCSRQKAEPRHDQSSEADLLASKPKPDRQIERLVESMRQ